MWVLHVICGPMLSENQTYVIKRAHCGLHGAQRGDIHDDDDVFYLFLQKQKIGAELHIYLEEGTYHKRLFRGPNPKDMKK